MAWETFGVANGVDDLAVLRARLSKTQEGARIQADPSGRIGCCLIGEARFFAPGDWITPPGDWSPRTQTGASYDLSVGEGARVWAECLARTSAPAPTISPAPEPERRFGAPVVYLPRLGQGIFRCRCSTHTGGRAP